MNMHSNQQQKPLVEVCYSPFLYDQYKDVHDIVVVIDVLRATSAMCIALHYGAKSIIPVSSIEDAKSYDAEKYILAAERNGEVVEGFSYGNSPRSYMGDDIKGKEIVLTTTNGTKTINIAADSEILVIGSLLNLDALSEWLIQQKKNVLLLCSGWKDKFNLEDTICAGAIAHNLIQTGEFHSEEDSSIAAKYLYLSARDNIFGYLKSSSHRRRLKRLNLNEDVKFCLIPNQTEVIPILKEGKLVRLE
jgi:2-phosphosulfolactate phosphatase